jgi:hypothetical protein
MTAKEIPEVAVLEEVTQRINNFMGTHDNIFNTYGELVDEYNAALSKAEKVVREKGISAGPFQISREYDEYDADKLFELVGREEFLKLGGTENTKRVLSVDKVKLRSFIAAGKVPEAVVEAIRTQTKKYSSPKPLKFL